VYDVTTNTGTNLGPIVRGRRFVQRFVARDDDLMGVSVWAATYHSQIASRATLTLLDETGRTVLREVSADTAGFADNAWQLFAFEPVRGSAGRAFAFAFETDAVAEAVTLWTNANGGEPAARDGEPIGETICHKSHYLRATHAVLDPVLARHAALVPELPAARRELLHEIVRGCVIQKQYYLLRLVHMLDGFDRTSGVRRVLSVGSGEGYHEAYLAARFPDLRVDGVDLTPAPRDFGLPNLRFFEADILRPALEGDYDFVFSIECLEHIEDRETAFRNMASLVRPGGYLYLSVPFASDAERRDPDLARYAWEVAEHHTLGYDFETLDAYFTANGLDVLYASNMFDCRIAHPLNALLHAMDASAIESVVEPVVRLFMLDLAPSRVASMKEAEGIKYLGRRGEGAART
jgi:SAM-dependent methyltransferase